MEFHVSRKRLAVPLLRSSQSQDFLLTSSLELFLKLPLLVLVLLSGTMENKSTGSLLVNDHFIRDWSYRWWVSEVYDQSSKLSLSQSFWWSRFGCLVHTNDSCIILRSHDHHLQLSCWFPIRKINGEAGREGNKKLLLSRSHSCCYFSWGTRLPSTRYWRVISCSAPNVSCFLSSCYLHFLPTTAVGKLEAGLGPSFLNLLSNLLTAWPKLLSQAYIRKF